MHVPLAADEEVLGRQDPTQPQSADDSGAIEAAVRAAFKKLVYVGSAGGIAAKRALAALLREASIAELPNANGSPPLVIFGVGWESEPEWAPYWAGVLPHVPGALNQIYGASFAVLGALPFSWL